MIDAILEVLKNTWGFLAESAFWLVVSYVVAGLVREFVLPKRVGRLLAGTRPRSVVMATFGGMLFPT
jgi:hypothetical protein